MNTQVLYPVASRKHRKDSVVQYKTMQCRLLNQESTEQFKLGGNGKIGVPIPTHPTLLVLVLVERK